MKPNLSLRLETRIRHLSTEDLQRITDQLFGTGAYIKLITVLDAEIIKSVSIIRKGTQLKEAQEIADKRIRLALEMQQARKYRKTKLGKLESHYLPIVHHLREGNLSWPSIVRLLKIRHRFTVSQAYLCRIYDEWLKRLDEVN